MRYSTPVENRHRPYTPIPVSPIDFAQSMLDNEQDSTHQPTMNDINRHLNVLWDISKSLQTQISKINEVMSQLIQKAEKVQKNAQIQEHVTISSSLQNQSSSSTPTDMVNNSNTVPGNSSYSEAVRNIPLPPNPVTSARQNPPCDKDKRNKKAQKQSGQSTNGPHERAVSSETNQQPTAPTLLIGDSILSGVNRRGLKSNIECLPISGATVDTLSKKNQNV